MTDHVPLQVGQGGQVKHVLDEVRWARLAQPQIHGVSVLQQEHAAVGQTLLGAAQRSRQSLAADVHVVLKKQTDPVLNIPKRRRPSAPLGGFI